MLDATSVSRWIGYAGLLASCVLMVSCAGIAIRSQLMRTASAEVFLGARLGAMAFSRAVPTALAERQITFTVVEAGQTIATGTLARTGSRVLITDLRSRGIVETVREGAVLRHVDARRQLVGVSRVNPDNRRVDHFRVDGSRETRIGFDEIVDQGRRIKHYDGPSKRLIGESELTWTDQVGSEYAALRVAVAIIRATIVGPEGGSGGSGGPGGPGGHGGSGGPSFPPQPGVSVPAYRVLEAWLAVETDQTGYPTRRASEVVANWRYGGRSPAEDAYEGKVGLVIRYEGSISGDYFHLVLRSEGEVRYQSYCHLNRNLGRNLFNDVFVCWYGPGPMPKPGTYVVEMRDRWGQVVVGAMPFAVLPR